MLNGRKPPGKGTGAAWSTVQTEAGTQWEAWVAGDCIGVEVHTSRRSKPCLKRYLGQKTPCEGCQATLRVDWLGYLPLYRCSDGKPVVVVVHTDQIDRLDQLKKHDHIVIGRNKEANCGVWVRKSLKQTRYDTTLPSRMVPADISDWLPVLWRMVGVITGRDLLRDSGANPPVDDKPVSHPEPVASGDDDSAAKEMLRALQAKAAQDLTPGEAVLAHRVLDYVTVPSTNGKHKRK